MTSAVARWRPCRHVTGRTSRDTEVITLRRRNGSLTAVSATPVIEMPRYTAQLLTSADFAVISETDRLYVCVQYLNSRV